MILGPRLDRFGPSYGAALGAQRPIHRLGQGVNDRRLLVAGIDDRRSAMVLEVADEGGDPRVPAPGRGFVFRRLPRDSQRPGQRTREALDFPDLKPQPMVGHGPGDRGGALGNVEPVHGLARRSGRALFGEVARVAKFGRPLSQKIAVEGDNDRGTVEVVNRVHYFSEGQLRAFEGAVAGGGLVLMPAGRGEILKQAVELGGEGRRGYRLGENPQAHSPGKPLRFDLASEDGHERQPTADLPSLRGDLGTVGVVEAQYRRLRDGVAGSQAGRVAGIALDLRGPPHVAFDEHPGGEAAQRSSRGEIERPARYRRFDRSGERDDRFRGLTRAGADPGESQRGPHQLQEAAPSEGSFHSEACEGNSSSSSFWNASVSATSLRLRQ